MKTLTLIAIALFAGVFIASTQAQNVSLKRQNAYITPTMTLAPTPTIDKMATVETTPTVSRPVVNINPTLRDCDYYFAQWGRRRARGTEADPFPFNKRVPLKVGCAVQTAEVNRVVNGR